MPPGPARAHSVSSGLHPISADHIVGAATSAIAPNPSSDHPADGRRDACAARMPRETIATRANIRT